MSTTILLLLSSLLACVLTFALAREIRLRRALEMFLARLLYDRHDRHDRRKEREVSMDDAAGVDGAGKRLPGR